MILIVFVLGALLAGLLWTWPIMLVLGAVAHNTGNLDWAWGYWQTYPIGLLVAFIINAVARR